MAENFPLTVRTTVTALFRNHDDQQQTFREASRIHQYGTAAGFPVQIEIPIFAFLSAQVSFMNFRYWQEKTAVPQQVPNDAKEDDWFVIPENYKPGIVIRNILRKYEE